MPVDHLGETPSQTAGPYVHIGTDPRAAGLDIRRGERLDRLVDKAGTAQPIRIEGIIYDGGGEPVRDAMIELWQADGAGRYRSGDFPGWGRASADLDTGAFSFETVKPGPAPWRDGRLQAPHVALLIFARGINIHLHTRMYFPDEEAANAADPVLAMVPPGRRATLVAERGGEDAVYRFAIHLQGDRETVFFDV
jgi:protocatechuate 3,4-dioxygenase, alpha subunit